MGMKTRQNLKKMIINETMKKLYWQNLFFSSLQLVVARGGIEPPAHGFSVRLSLYAVL